MLTKTIEPKMKVELQQSTKRFECEPCHDRGSTHLQLMMHVVHHGECVNLPSAVPGAHLSPRQRATDHCAHEWEEMTMQMPAP